MKSTKLIAACILYLIASLVASGAIAFQMQMATDIAGFGTALATLSSSTIDQYQRKMVQPVPRSDIALKAERQDISVPSSGTAIYVQIESRVASVFSFPLGGTVAILHPESYISLVSGLVLETEMKNRAEKGQIMSLKKGENLGQAIGSGIYPEQYFGLRLYDAKNSLWINPLFLASWLQDRMAPVIQNVWLTDRNKGGSSPIELKTAAPKGKYLVCQQDTYDVSIEAFDMIIPGSRTFSAPYRIIIRLDGKTSIDTSFLAAKCKDEGLSFLDNPAPSSKAMMENGAYHVGSIFLQRGQHEIEVLVSDYAGNQSISKASLMVN